MDKIYHSPDHPASYGGRKLLYDAVKTTASKKSVERFLGRNKTYRKFKKNPSKFNRARIFVTSIGHMFQVSFLLALVYIKRKIFRLTFSTYKG